MSAGHDLVRTLAALPHGEPFRFVNELTAITPLVCATGVWIVTGEERFFEGHFPGEPIVPGVLLAEALAQVCGLVAFAGGHEEASPATSARLAQMDIKIRAAVRPPARITLAATFVRDMGNLLLFEVVATANGAAAADGRIVLARTPPRRVDDETRSPCAG